MLWYWPRGLPAVGHISHDTDGNDPAKAVAMLEVMNRCRDEIHLVHPLPGRLSARILRTLQEQGFEVALHYDALAAARRRPGRRKTSCSSTSGCSRRRGSSTSLEQEPLHAVGGPTRLLPLVRRGGHPVGPDARAEQEGHDRFCR